MQELIKKKREIIDVFLKNGVLISSELLNEINDTKDIPGIFETLKSKRIDDVVIHAELNKLINETKNQKQTQ